MLLHKFPISNFVIKMVRALNVRSTVLIARTHYMVKNSVVLLLVFASPMRMRFSCGSEFGFFFSLNVCVQHHTESFKKRFDVILKFSIISIGRQQRFIKLFLYPFDFIYSIFFLIRQSRKFMILDHVE